MVLLDDLLMPVRRARQWFRSRPGGAGLGSGGRRRAGQNGSGTVGRQSLDTGHSAPGPARQRNTEKWRIHSPLPLARTVHSPRPGQAGRSGPVGSRSHSRCWPDRHHTGRNDCRRRRLACASDTHTDSRSLLTLFESGAIIPDLPRIAKSMSIALQLTICPVFAILARN